MKLDIIKEDCLISHFQHVLRSSLTPRKITHTQGRAWDGFCYILNGSCRYIFSDGTEFTATRGCVIYLARDSLYNMHITEGSYESIFCDFSSIPSLRGKARCLSLRIREKPRIDFFGCISAFR